MGTVSTLTTKTGARSLGVEDRIGKALTGAPTAAELEELIADVREAVQAAQDVAEEAREKALNPILPAAEIDSARRVLSDSEFRRDRLKVASDRLGPLLTAAREREAQAEAKKRWAAVLAERDALAAELAETYPAICNQLTDLLRRIAANDARVGNMAPTAEALARHAPEYWDVRPSQSLQKLTRMVRLPAFAETNSNFGMAWPPNA